MLSPSNNPFSLMSAVMVKSYASVGSDMGVRLDIFDDDEFLSVLEVIAEFFHQRVKSLRCF